MLAFILYAILGWFLFNLVFRIIIPVYRTTRKMKKKFREMSARMNHSDGQAQMQQEEMRQQGFNQQSSQKTSPAPAGDYIDFEEVK